MLDEYAFICREREKEGEKDVVRSEKRRGKRKR